MSRNISYLAKTLVVAGILMAAQPALAKKVWSVPEFDAGAAGVAAVLVIGGAVLLTRKRKA